MYSAGVFTANADDTASSIGPSPMSVMGAKSASGSYGSLACVAATVRNVDDVNSSTEPSRGALATDSLPMMPEAPALLSTMTLVSKRFASGPPIARATTSLLPPGPNGTTIFTSEGGFTSAAATGLVASSAPPNMAIRRIKVSMMVSQCVG